MDLNRLPEEDDASDGGGSDSQGSESDVFCSICLHPANKNVERTVVKLKCKHKFHLDCIGSAFNVKRVMECPNCRKFEIGEWRYEREYVPVADLWNYEDEVGEEMIGQSYFPQMEVSIRWGPYNDGVAPVAVHFNEGNVFASGYTHAPVNQWTGPFEPPEVQVQVQVLVQAPASAFQGIDAPYLGWEEQHESPLTAATERGHILGAAQTAISAPASIHPFPAPQSPYYQSVQPEDHAVLPSLQQQYYQQQAYNATLPNHLTQTLTDRHGPVTGSGFNLSSQNLSPRYFTRSAATPLQNFREAGFPTSTEHLVNVGREVAQPADSPSFFNRLNNHT